MVLPPMSEFVTHPSLDSFNRRFFVALAGIGIYVVLLFIPKWWPAFGGTGIFLVYIASIPFALIGLLTLLIWGIVGAKRTRLHSSIASQHHRMLVVLALVGLLMLSSVFGLVRVIQGELPTGSNLLVFNSEIWQDPHSSNFVQGDITPRQKMLGSVVGLLKPTLDRFQLETLLGPTLDTSYFDDTGRDLIYFLGPERDSFFRIDSEWLLIWIDDSGHFERFAIARD